DLEAVGLGRLLHFLGDRQREKIVAGQDRDFFHIRGLRLNHLGQRRGQGVIRREGAEQVFVALVIDLGGGCGGGNGRPLLLYRDRARSLGGARAEGPEQEIDVVLGDHLLGSLHRARR